MIRRLPRRFDHVTGALEQGRLGHELIYPPIQEFWDAAVSGTS